MTNKKEKIDKVYNFKELVEKYKTYGENVVFKYKLNGKIEEITYQQYADDIKAVRNCNDAIRNKESCSNRE